MTAYEGLKTRLAQEPATWLVTGDPTASPVRRLCAFARSLGATRVLAMDVAAHDALVALISHVPQLVVDALAAGVGESASFESAVELAGTGWRDTTRIASSPWETWEPIVRLNRAAIIQPLQRVHEELGRLLHALHTDDTEALAPVFERAIRAREYYEAVRTAPIARQVALARSENVWWDRSLGYRTLRTSAPTAPAHARLALAFLAAQTGHPVEGEMDPDVPYAAEIARVLALPYAETYTADGLLVRGVIIDQELVVLP